MKPDVVTRVKRRVRALVQSRRETPEAISAGVAEPVQLLPTSGAAEDWSLQEILSTDRGWLLSVDLPADLGSLTAALVLSGRASLTEVHLPVTFEHRTGSVTVPAHVLAVFPSETLDLWIILRDDEGAGTRRRLGVAPALSSRGTEGSVPGARWYVTVNGNCSLEISAPLAGSQDQVPPTLLEFEETRSQATLLVSDGAVDQVLLLVGREKQGEIVLPREEDLRGRITIVDLADLAAFARDVVDVFVASTSADGCQIRRRVSTGDALVESRTGVIRRWYSTAEGNISIRRQTPVEAILEAGVFDVEFYLGQVPDLPAGVDPVEHYVSKGAAAGLNPSSMFDTSFYRAMNPGIKRRNPLAHYCEYGWKELKNPSPRFDTWWYWSKHLDPADESVNPLAHYQMVGRSEGLSTRPDPLPSRSLGRGQELVSGRPVRRVCLFAGYDQDGIVDDYVVDYVSELSRYADVYYLADGAMATSELDKLAGVTQGAWGQRHGEYDFGSYARLAERVGWETIEQYDELLLVNDSCYLLRPLAEVFSDMEVRACDWWGLQATKGTWVTNRQGLNQFRDPISMTSVRTTLVDSFEQDYTYDFHVGSYFLAYRQPVIRDPEFRRYLASVTIQLNKRNIVHKYEIGLTHWLIQHGHPFDTFVDRLYPFHPIFTKWYFRLLEEGFPLLKRFFLSENHYHVPRLEMWPALIGGEIPDLDIGMFQRNLVRVTDPDRLRRSLTIGADVVAEDEPVADELLDDAAFEVADTLSPKHRDWWAFPVCDRTGAFSGNERAVFEEVKDDPSIRKIVLTRGREVVVDGVNVEVVPLESPIGQHRLMRAGTILIKQNRNVSALYPVSSELHNLIAVWHGIPFKRIGYISADFQGMLDRIFFHHSQYRAVVASSKVDALAMTAAFYPLTVHQIWNTGLPRNDFILRDEDRLPHDLQADLAKLRGLVGGRRLVLFMPTFRNAQSEGYYRFAAEEIAWLDRWLRSNNCVLGVREHMADSARLYSAQLTGLPILDLSDAEFSHPEMLYRESAALITDYSSAFIDYLLTGKPAISFAYDYEFYLLERGGFYDLDMVFPGPICKNFADLQTALGHVFDGRPDATHALKKQLFFDHVDDHSSARVVERIRDLTATHGIGTWPGERVA